MINYLIQLALRQRVVVIGVALILLGVGIFAFTQLDIEAYPDPVQPMVEVLTLPNGLGAEEVERLVTVPLEFGLSGMLGLQAMRSISLYGLSDIRCYFDWDSDYNFDRTQTINQLTFRHAAAGNHAGNLAAKSGRRDLSLHRRESRSRFAQGEGDRGLGGSRSSSRRFPGWSMSPDLAD